MAASPYVESMVSFRINARKLKRRAAVAAALHLGLFAALIVLWTPTVLMCINRFRGNVTAGSSAAALGAGAVEIWLLLILLRGVAGLATNKPRVVPYFKEKGFRDLNRKASEESSIAFRSGFGIAADLSRLDDLARGLHVTPLSIFGFGDDLFEQCPQWTDLTEGMRTVTALVERLERGGTAQMSATTPSDLKALAAALQKAQESQTTFSLIVRGRDDFFISSYEMEKRDGTFWC